MDSTDDATPAGPVEGLRLARSSLAQPAGPGRPVGQPARPGVPATTTDSAPEPTGPAPTDSAPEPVIPKEPGPEPRWLDAEQQVIWRRWLAASSQLNVRLAQDLRPFGLDLSEYEVLMTLSDAPHWSLRMSELAEQANQSRSRLTHTVARMELRGLVARFASPDDRRGVTAQLTDAGYDLLRRAAPGHVTAVRRWLVDTMSADEYRALGVALGHILDADPR